MLKDSVMVKAGEAKRSLNIQLSAEDGIGGGAAGPGGDDEEQTHSRSRQKQRGIKYRATPRALWPCL